MEDNDARGDADPTQVYFNGACSKCRTLAGMLEERDDVTYVRYLDVPPSIDDLKRLMTLLGIEDPREMMRTGESVYAELGLAGVTGDALLDAIHAHPILLERPIVVHGDRAVIARPPERVAEILTTLPTASATR
jgi:arsenate reductase